jgi:hypothetical protein
MIGWVWRREEVAALEWPPPADKQIMDLVRVLRRLRARQAGKHRR